MGRKPVSLLAITLVAAATGCGGGDDQTSTNAQITSTTTADPRPLYGPCASGTAVGVDGLSCEDADVVLTNWPRGGRPDPSTQKLCEPPTTAGRHHRADPGISCDAVDDFVAHDFAPHPPGWVERQAGATCRIDDGKTGLLVTCQRDGEWFAFAFS